MKYLSIIGLLAVAIIYFSFTTVGNNKLSSGENIII